MREVQGARSVAQDRLGRELRGPGRDPIDVPDSEPMEVRSSPIDPDGDSATAHILRLVGRGRSVLALGAGFAEVARSLTDLNGCGVTVVEPDEVAAGTLGSACHRVICVDPNETGWVSSVPQGSFDAVVIAGALPMLHD